jgi:hypothetical protein
MGEDEDRAVIGRVVTPPALPFLIAPVAAFRPEHVATHDRRAEVFLPLLGTIVVDPRLARVGFAEHRFERTRTSEPVVQLVTAST